jgi:hypothetical protein
MMMMYNTSKGVRLSATQFIDKLRRTEKVAPAIFKFGPRVPAIYGTLKGAKAQKIAMNATKGEASFLSKIKTFGKTPAGRMTGKVFKGLGYVVDILWTYDVATEWYDRINPPGEKERPSREVEQGMDQHMLELMKAGDSHASTLAMINLPDSYQTDKISSSVGQDIADLVAGRLTDNHRGLESFFMALDALPVAIDDKYTGRNVATLLRAVAHQIEAEQPYAILYKKVLKVDIDHELEHFGDAQKTFEAAHNIHSKYDVEFMGEAMVTPINYGDFQTQDANGQIIGSLAGHGYFDNDYRFKS